MSEFVELIWKRNDGKLLRCYRRVYDITGIHEHEDGDGCIVELRHGRVTLHIAMPPEAVEQAIIRAQLRGLKRGL